MADTITLYRDYWGGTEKTFTLAHLNLDSLSSGQYVLDRTGTVTLPDDTHTEARWIQVSMASWDNHDLSVLANLTPTDDNNRIIGTWSMVGADSVRNFMGCNEGWYPTTVGTKPEDWDKAWQAKYFTRSHISGSSLGPSSDIYYMSHVNSTWDSSTQYYYSPDYLKRPTNIYVTKESKLAWSYCNWFSTATSPQGYQNVGIRPFTIFGNATSASLSKILWNMPDIGGQTLATGTTWSNLSNIFYNIDYYNSMDWSSPNHYAQMIEVTYGSKTYYGTIEIDYKRNGQINYENPNWCNIIALEDVAWGNIESGGEGGEYDGPNSGPQGGSGNYNGFSEDCTFTGKSVDGTNGSTGLGSLGARKTFVLTRNELSTVLSSITAQSSSSLDEVTKRLEYGILDCYNLALPATTGNPAAMSILGEDLNMTKPIIGKDQDTTGELSFNMSLFDFYDSFLDCQPYYKCQIFLPFIGTRELPANIVCRGTLLVNYLQDNFSGDLVAHVAAVDKYENRIAIAEYVGNGKRDIPLTQTTQNSARTSQLMASWAGAIGSAVGGAKAGAALGSFAGPEGSAIGGAIGFIGGAIAGTAATAGSRRTILAQPELNGAQICSYSGSNGWLGQYYPYVIVTKSIYKQPTSFARDYGYIAHYTMQISDCKGLCFFSNVDVSTIACTDIEKSLILSYLTAGVYVNSYDAT